MQEGIYESKNKFAQKHKHPYGKIRGQCRKLHPNMLENNTLENYNQGILSSNL